MNKTRSFKVMTFTTYLPIPLLGIMVIFGLLGKLFNVGWLESAPDVLLIPTLLAYYVSLVMGGIIGFMKKEDSVYLMAFIGCGVWVLGFLLSSFLTFDHYIMIGINIVLLAAILVLHILQYIATKKWENRLDIAA